MNDTSPDIAERFRKLMMQKTGEERLLMGCSMYDDAKKIVSSSIYAARPDITEGEMRKEIFIRFYGQEFSQSEREKILLQLGSKEAQKTQKFNRGADVLE